MRLPIIAALDNMDPKTAIALIQKVGHRIWGFKFNDLYHHPQFGLVYEALKDSGGARSFIDLKFHDIPNTVANMVRKVLTEYPRTDILTAHTSGGGKMIEAAVDANKIAKTHCAIAAVTVLTSLGEDDCNDLLGDCRNIKVGEFAVLANKNGAEYLVCSAMELNEVVFPAGIKKIVPGIRTGQYTQADDQACVGSVFQALLDGADLLVIGRAITKAEDPEKAIEEIAKEITAAREAVAKKAIPAATPKPIETETPSEEPRVSVANEFIALAISVGAFMFGDFTLKSGRKSPYFFNSGLFNSGELMHQLAGFYAWAVNQSVRKSTVIAGPAYKGVPLATHTSEHLRLKFFFDRKEPKSYGDGGDIVGYKPTEEDLVTILDDVITTGKTKIDFLEVVKRYTQKVVQLVVAFDRQELPDGAEVTAVQEFSGMTGIPVRAIATLDDLFAFLRNLRERNFYGGLKFSQVFKSAEQADEIIGAMEQYQEKYCVR